MAQRPGQVWSKRSNQTIRIKHRIQSCCGTRLRPYLTIHLETESTALYKKHKVALLASASTRHSRHTEASVPFRSTTNQQPWIFHRLMIKTTKPSRQTIVKTIRQTIYLRPVPQASSLPSPMTKIPPHPLGTLSPMTPIRHSSSTTAQFTPPTIPAVISTS